MRKRCPHCETLLNWKDTVFTPFKCPYCNMNLKGLTPLLAKYKNYSLEELERERDECLISKILNKVGR